LVVANLGAVGDGALIAPAEFEIAFVDAECGEQRVAVNDAWAVRLEECLPVRGFPSYKGEGSAARPHSRKQRAVGTGAGAAGLSAVAGAGRSLTKIGVVD
jgi:hypothetical protein